jgi:prepilin-type processing-associated H-X9-DG protein/prepilin-type N-terminal cleavage/methylation domain-containing protein
LPAASRNAFTLIELLVVITIIGTLAALILSAVRSAQASSHAAECTSNLRQIGVAFQLYLADHQNTLPQRFYGGATDENGTPLGYDELLLPYTDGVTKIFRCKAHRKTNYPEEPSYGMNWFYDNANVNTVENSIGTILVAETRGSSGTGSHRADGGSRSPGQLDDKRHQGHANYLFFDGHVERLKYEETLSPVNRWGTDQEMHGSPAPGG